MTDYRAPIRALREKIRAFGAKARARIPDRKGEIRKYINLNFESP
mgnify:CR=1 FL=1